ncbi:MULTISPECIES: sulfotransferase family 2 domain-containing protein [unclassified Ruegeria]|uniref:sulfotransferase family 2 domain-containing protein n=1 Tax=unclassified Ruegeria TaxID=2625375 RepID=UPI001489E389|nr:MULTISPECIES: sulfotransferase family 2 domain-containing protein [unclassified Ruegeria]NOD34968.1 sulfotransferase family 2 domain-containing protein [Ruegeria sp. HKCCD7296]NOE35212.1 sulfotransferase family 2 domain-containing protein [Ruegeria sp. HKCCD7318]NOE42055.1 sulfotransferase family 2 domain-containing protein [Ruegeria sp. HKCCD7319]
MVAFLDKYNIAYFGVHKAAGTSIKHVLYKIETGNEWDGKITELHPRYPTRPVRQSDFEKARDYWSFAVVRDPIKRFLSGYQNRVHDFEDLKKVPVGSEHQNKLIGKLFGMRNQQPFKGFKTNPTIEEFIRDYDKYCDVSRVMYLHTCPIDVFLGQDIGFFDAVYTTSELDRLAADLSERLNTTVHIGRRNSSSTTPPRFEDLSKESKDFLVRHTQADYELLGAFFPTGQNLINTYE